MNLHSTGLSLPDTFQDGRYKVKELLGEGSTKTVYRVQDTRLEREVAFALIRAAGLEEADRKRILREARTMAKLGEHPNIVQIYDFGEEDGQPFMVLPLLDGGTIEPLVKKAAEGEVDFDTVLRVASDVAKGLEFAHSKRVIHRDVKPGNVWLTAEGVAKIGDFGIAFMPAHTRVTQTGLVLGTVAYMPPEQAMGLEVNERSDLYSFGAMLYELTTGRRPFPGDHPVAVISQHINVAPVAPTQHNPQIPPQLETLILELMAKDPVDRPQSASAVLADLEAIGTGPTLVPPLPTLDKADRTPLRVLIVDSSESSAAPILEELRRGGYDPTYQRVDTPLTMNTALETRSWDVVISNYSMPRFSAPAALKVLEINGLDLPFIVVSKTITEEIAVAVMKAGAHDYVMKDNLARLNPAIQRELREAEVRLGRRKAEELERRLHQELEARQEQLEQRIRKLTAQNRLFQEQQRQRSQVDQASRALLEGLRKLAQDANALTELTQDMPAKDLQDVPSVVIEADSTPHPNLNDQPLSDIPHRTEPAIGG
jgi:serine/threonine protein kinase